MTADSNSLNRRVARAAAEALAKQGLVTPLDVLIGLGWLHPAHLDPWRQGRVSDLEQLVQVSSDKVALAMELLQRWATARGLESTKAAYLGRRRGREPLHFSAHGGEAIERAFCTQWLSPELTDRERERLLERHSRPPELVVIQPLADFTCAICATEGAGLLIMQGSGPACMSCADMDHLVFLPSGDATLTRRAEAGSGLWAVVVRFSRSRRRYERQGILVEGHALERAEATCLADEDARARRREREQARRAKLDLELQRRMASEIRRLFPGCPQRARSRSPITPRPAGAGGSAAVPRGGRSIRERSSWRSRRRSATTRLTTTSC